jgi:hypothetical protein
VVADLFVTTYYRRPDRLRVEQSSVLPTGKSASVFVVTPTAVKGGAAGQRLRAAPPIAERRLRAAMFEDPNFFVQNVLDASPVIPVQLAPPLEDAGRAFDGVVFQTPAGEWTTLYFDGDTHLLARIKSAGEGGVDQVELLEDYREVGGIKFAHQQTSTGQSGSRAHVTEIKVNAGLDPSLFE